MPLSAVAELELEAVVQDMGLPCMRRILDSGRTDPFVERLRKCMPACERIMGGGGEKSITHGDLFLSNLILSNEADDVTVLDLEDASISHVAYDVAMTLIGCCRPTEGDIDAGASVALLKGYGELKVEAAELHAWIQYAAMALAAFRYERYNMQFYEEARARDHEEMTAVADSVSLPLVAEMLARARDD